MALPRHLHDAKLRNRQNLALGLVFFHLVFEPLVDGLPVLAALHVDGVDYDEPPEVAEPDLARGLRDGFEIRLQNKILPVGVLALVGPRIDVDRNQRLGLVDDDFPAGRQRNPPLESLGYLPFDVVALEDRNVFLEELDLALGAAGNFRDGAENALVLGAAVD